MSTMQQRVLAMLALAAASVFAVAVRTSRVICTADKAGGKKDRLRAGERPQDVLRDHRRR